MIYTQADVSNEDAAHFARFAGCSINQAKAELAKQWNAEEAEWLEDNKEDC